MFSVINTMSQISSKFLSEAWVFGNVDLFIIISVLIVISSFILKLISKLSKKLLPVIRSMVSHYFQICWCAIKIIFGDGEGRLFVSTIALVASVSLNYQSFLIQFKINLAE